MSKQKRLAILGTRGIPALYGGFETFAQELSVRLVQRGHAVTVYCEEGEAGQREPKTFRGVQLEYLPVNKLGPLTTILFDLHCLWHARKKYDVVYMLGYGASVFCFIPRLWGSEVWINMDGVEWARSKWGTMAKLWFRLMEMAAMWTPDRIVADAGGILAHLKSRHFRIPPCSVIPYGAPLVEQAPDPAELDEWNLKPGEYDLIVCRLEPENSVREIIAGFKLSENGRPLIIVGSVDPATQYVKELLQMQDDRIRFIGTVYDKQKLQALRFHAGVYFHGHTVGGTNPSLLEAMGCGNLIIAHDNIFNRETAGDAAFYFGRSSDISLLIQAASALTPEEKRERKRTVRERIHLHYTWDGIAGQYEEVLERLPQKVQQPSYPEPSFSFHAANRRESSHSRQDFFLPRNK